MSIRVGITENVKLAGAKINDKGSLEVSFKDASAGSRSKDLLDTLAGTKDFSVTNIILWPVKVDGQSGEARDLEQIVRDLNNLRDQLEQILGGYMTSDKATLDPYAGFDISNKEAFQAAVKKQSGVDQVYKNLTTQFVARVAALQGTPEFDRTFRLKLVRTSKTKHFGTLPKSFVRDNPFFESTDIPVASSKVKFTNYEKKNGYDNGDEIAKSTADSVPAGEVSAADSILGIR